jgi:signal peptidase I
MSMTISRFWREWIRGVILPALAVLAAKSALADAEFVPTGSMTPTIYAGEEVVVNKLAYDLKVPFTLHRLAEWAAPARGDIVVFFRPGDGERLVKRVVGLPGDVIAMRDDRLFINGRGLAYRDGLEDLTGVVHRVMELPERPAIRNFGPIRVPEGSYFMMGDNRDNSADSRYFGFVPRERIVGKAEAVAFSVDLDHFARPRFDRFFTELR